VSEHIYGPDDVTITWDADDPAAVARADEDWRGYEAKGYELYAPDGSLLPSFDATLGVAIAVPGVPPPEVLKAWGAER
jgi:hypothetical protein